MASSRLRLAILLFLTVLGTCVPFPFSGGQKPGKGPKIPVPELYPKLHVHEIPTTFASDAVLTNCPRRTRYGYFVSRPVARLFRNPYSRYILTVIRNYIQKAPPILHWALLVSEEPTLDKDGKVLPLSGTQVPCPRTGLILELRNSARTGLLYLDVKNWTTYVTARQDKLQYLGTLNRTDDELIQIGRAYIRQVGLQGFSAFYRNCQHFTTWYIKALWPETQAATRIDQVLGKAAWWVRDWRKTLVSGLNKIRGWLGYPEHELEPMDSEIEFVTLDELLREDIMRR